MTTVIQLPSIQNWRSASDTTGKYIETCDNEPRNAETKRRRRPIQTHTNEWRCRGETEARGFRACQAEQVCQGRQEWGATLANNAQWQIPIEQQANGWKNLSGCYLHDTGTYRSSKSHAKAIPQTGTY